MHKLRSVCLFHGEKGKRFVLVREFGDFQCYLGVEEVRKLEQLQ